MKSYSSIAAMWTAGLAVCCGSAGRAGMHAATLRVPFWLHIRIRVEYRVASVVTNRSSSINTDKEFKMKEKGKKCYLKVSGVLHVSPSGLGG